MDAMLNEAKGFWEVGLKHLVKELPDFDLVIDELRHGFRESSVVNSTKRSNS
ncbi:MAG: hypothetical protein GQ533_02070 [Methanosarcinaceae archaeon]|nr:hypothetical protein [Methanosarcinaceae archaeon]